MKKIKFCIVLVPLLIGLLICRTGCNKTENKTEQVDGVTKVYLRTGDLHRKLDAHYVEPLPMSFMYSIYVTKIEDGIFKVMFEANPC